MTSVRFDYAAGMWFYFSALATSLWLIRRYYSRCLEQFVGVPNQGETFASLDFSRERGSFLARFEIRLPEHLCPAGSFASRRVL
jgi:hypothetical protein